LETGFVEAKKETGMTGRIARWINQLIMGLALFVYGAENADAQGPVAVTLLPSTSPTAGEPGVTNISVTGSNFPVGTIQAANITVTLKAGAGAPVTTPATAIATVVGTTRRVSFTIPASVSVLAATTYAVTLAGTTSTGTAFQSSNSSALTVNPLAVISTLTPNSGQTGQSLTVTVTGQFSNFLQGATVASFGAGITVVSTKVTDATHLTLNISIAGNASVGPRTVTLTTGAEVASLTNGFTVSAAGGNPTITDFNPKSGSIGTLVTISGSNLLPNAGTSAQVTLAKQGGGTMSLPASSATSVNIAFVVPAGAMTGPGAVMVNGGSANTAVPLTIVPSSGFSLTAAPPSANLISGQTVAYTVQLNSTYGFNQLAQLSLSGVPSGVTATFSPPNITAGQTSILKLTAPAGQPTSTNNLSISATTTVDGLPVVQGASTSLSVVAPTTTLLGRTVVTDATETPLAGVTVKTLALDGNGNTTGCAGHSTVSDAAGNFSLTGLPLSCTGPQLIGFDGTTATSPQGKYAGVNLIFTLTQGLVTAAPVLVHLPRIDTAETFLVTQNSSTDQSYSWRGIPGLSVTVYANTTFTLPDGTQPNPFPLAAVSVPVDRLPDAKAQVPTMIMVFIVAFQPANAFTNQPVAISYPNTVYNPAGATSILMTLDPTHGVMVPYGTATVSSDATQFVPDPDPAHPGHRYGLVHFDWHMVGTPVGNQSNPCNGCRPCARCGGSVDLSTGLEVIEETDISYGGARGSISIVRTYRNGINAAATTFGPFGYGTNHNWGYELDSVNPSTASVISLIMPDGNRFPFAKQANGTFINSSVPVVGGGTMTVTGNAVDLRWKDGTTFHFIVIFNVPFFRTLLDSVTDPNGNKFQITHNGFQIQAITDATGRSLTFNYNVGGCITQITAPDGTFVSYDYKGNGFCANASQLNFVADLRQVTRTDGSITQYSYDNSHNLTSVTDQAGATFDSITYDNNARVIQEKLGNGGILTYAYTLQNPLAGMLSPVLATTVTDALENQTVYRFNTNQGVVGVTDPLGQMRTIDRDGGNFVVGMHGTGTCGVCGDPAAGDQTFSYDDSTGNLLSSTDGIGNTTTYTYDPMFNKLTSVKDTLGNMTLFTIDSRGNRLTQKDPNGNITSYAYDQYGELMSVTDALSQKTSVGYDVYGNLTSVKDAVGNVTAFQYDGNGRMTRTQDALGRATTLTYDGANRITSQTNDRGGVTRFAYDELGDLTSVTDARGNKTIFTYDLMKQLLTRTDPLGRIDSRTYDLNGNLIQFQDRRGQTSHFAYDIVNRLITETYSDATVTRSYDANGRLGPVNDSAGGTFAFTYDPTGRTLSSATPFGEIQYAYDARGAVTSRQVVGQPAVTYSYDPAGNLAGATMPQMSAAFAYTPRNQLAGLSRANGVSSNFVYDNAARLLSITHAKGAVIDAESYGYDTVGNRSFHSTSMGQPLITPATASAAYDAANEQNQFGPMSNTFDANGNLLSSNASIGNNTFAWDSRGRLKSIATPVGQVTSFTYDFAGNLIAQADTGPTLNLTKSFLLDDLTNVAYESASDGSSYSVLSGRSVDSHLGIAQSSGQIQYGLADAINSTVATVDQGGILKSQFVYEPYGLTTTASTYPFQFTGRTQASGTFYYFRARFYNTASGRFIGEDLLGRSGSLNLYRYGLNSPANGRDPFGLQSQDDDNRQALQVLNSIAAANDQLNHGVNSFLDDHAVALNRTPRQKNSWVSLGSGSLPSE
jgi:RHS repeat-associated protein